MTTLRKGSEMKKYAGAWVVGIAMIGAGSLWAAPPPLTATPSVKLTASTPASSTAAADEPWIITLGPAAEFFTFEHDALQQRKDTEFNTTGQDDWREGRTSGSGWGLRMTASKGKDQGSANLVFLTSKTDFDLDVPPGSPQFG